MTDWKPGDVANGHVLGNDGVWHRLATPAPEPEPEAETTSELPGRDAGPSSDSTCPRCGQNDQVKQVSGLTAHGTSATTGTASTVGLGINTAGVIGVGGASSKINLSTTSGLVSRFAPPKTPNEVSGSDALFLFAGFCLGFGIGQAISFLFFDGAGWVPWLTGLIVGGIAIGPQEKKKKLYEHRKSLWRDARARSLAAFYCARDDVAWEAGDTSVETPEGLMDRIFLHYRSSAP